jgi:hypothetical protein
MPHSRRALPDLRLPQALLAALAVLATACSSQPPTTRSVQKPGPTTTAAGPTTAAAPRHYVSLGDSYSAGEGLPDPVQPCGRAPGAYPNLVAERARLVPSFHACNGATTADVIDDEQAPGTGRQIDAVLRPPGAARA